MVPSMVHSSGNGTANGRGSSVLRSLSLTNPEEEKGMILLLMLPLQ